MSRRVFRDALGVEMPRVSGCSEECFEMPRSGDTLCVEMLEVGKSRESGWNNMLIMNMMHVCEYVKMHISTRCLIGACDH